MPSQGRLLSRLGQVRPRRWFAELVFNRIFTHIPSNRLRIRLLRGLGMSAGPHVYLFGSSEFLAPENLSIEANCHIGRYCQVDARGGIDIARNVVIASHTLLVTADHDVQASGFDGRLGRIVIENRVWIGSRAVILRGVTLGEGAVIAAGSVVHRDVEPWSIVSGVPARIIGTRSADQSYEIDQGPDWY